MESSIKSSFIPHEVSGGGTTGRASPSGMVDIMALISLVVFVASVALAIGVFLYVQFLSAESQSKLDQLERAKAAFEPALIDELARLDDRMHAASDVLSNHIAPSSIFALLEQITLQSIVFQSFELAGGESKVMTLSMKGVASSMNAIALQADLFNKSGLIANPIFSDISRGANGVTFIVTSEIDHSALSYERMTAAVASIPQNAGVSVPQSVFVPSRASGDQATQNSTSTGAQEKQ